MKQVQGIWLPDRDEHFATMMAKAAPARRGEELVGTYQKHKLDAALVITRQRRTAVDIGAHVGFWSMWLADAFDHVHSFEPVTEHRDCFRANVTQPNVTLHEYAVGASRKTVSMLLDPENTGKARVHGVSLPEATADKLGVCTSFGEAGVPMVTLDELKLADVDLLKIDVEGMEGDVIAGAAETIGRCKPVIVIEQNGATTEVATLLRIGMRVATRISHDWILRW